MDSAYSAPTLQENTFALSLARAYFENLSNKHETALANSTMLRRLCTELGEAIATAESTCTPETPFEDCLEKKSHILWLCNQCDYYLTAEQTDSFHPRPTANTSQIRDGLWQVKAVVKTMIFLKLTTQCRAFLPGPTPKMLTWRDILPGLQLWTMGRGRHG